MLRVGLGRDSAPPAAGTVTRMWSPSSCPLPLSVRVPDPRLESAPGGPLPGSAGTRIAAAFRVTSVTPKPPAAAAGPPLP